MELMQNFYRVHGHRTMAEEDERRRQLGSSQHQAKKRTRAAATKQGTSRHVPWTDEDASHYTLVRKGIPMPSTAEADRLFGAKQIQEAHFYLWKHTDPHLERNASIPKWEATYFFEDRQQHARVKKCHLKIGYQSAGRVSHDEIWSLDPQTRLPYWVDRYAFSKIKQKSSKIKYEDSKRGSDKESGVSHNANSTE